VVRRRLALLALPAVVALLLLTPASASAVSGAQAARIVARTPVVQDQARRHGPLRASTAIQFGTTNWEVRFFAGKTEVARAFVDSRDGRLVSKVFTGKGLIGPSARGVKSTFRDRVNWATLVLCVMFVLPFVDPRRLFRMLHLDLLAFLGFEVSFLLQQKEHLVASVWVQYVPLLYLVGRFMWLGLRGADRRDGGPLVPYASDRVLAAGLVALVVGRLVFNVVWSAVGDVGYAGLFGADGLTHGYDLYGNSTARLDAYGPVNYFFYVPFVLLFPMGLGWSHNNLEGAHLASITLDLAVIVLLMLLGRRLASGREGRRLGLALGYAWAAYPLALFPLAVNSNDGIVAAAVLGALLAYGSPIGRAVVLGLGAAAKFGPLGLVPVFALGRERSWRNAALVCTLAVAIFVLAFVPYIRQSGLDTVWDSTLGFQIHRHEPFTLWGLYPSLRPLQVVVQVLAIACVAAASWLPRERSVPAIAALSAGVLVALQMAGGYWAHTYIIWFAAPGFVALFALQLRRPLQTGQAAARLSSAG
jgi:hypothetical protein